MLLKLPLTFFPFAFASPTRTLVYEEILEP
jgi:hypothetical protein